MDFLTSAPMWLHYFVFGVLLLSMLWAVGWFYTSRSESILDDYFVKIAFPHLALIVILVAVRRYAFDQGGLSVAMDNSFKTLMLVNAAAFLIRLARLFVHSASETVRESARNRSIGFALPLIIQAMTLFFVFGCLLWLTFVWFGFGGFQLSLTVLGASSFLIAYIFQEPMQNLFGGVSLLMDSPFEYGDLIILDDGKTYRVDSTGARVTQLYDIKEHTHAYVPNVKLGGQTIINITHPDTELREVLDVSVTHGSDLRLARDLLIQLACGHPNILAPIGSKLPHLQAEDRFSDLLDNEAVRLTQDRRMRDHTEALLRYLLICSEFARRAEAHGLSPEQRKSLKELVEEGLSRLEQVSYEIALWMKHETYLELVYSLRLSDNKVLQDRARRLLTYIESDTDKLAAALWEECASAGKVMFGSGLVPALRMLSEDIGQNDKQPILRLDRASQITTDLAQEIASVASLSDIERNFLMWRRRVQQARSELETALKFAVRKGADDYLVHAHLTEAVEILREKFKLRIPGQQHPSVEVLEFGQGTVGLRLEYFVDNIAGEHFKRRERVRSDLFTRIDRRFAEAGIEIPGPRLKILR